MRILPILFSAPMVRALLDGRKTQTRRVLREDERPRYAVGDRLWVKEEWSGHYHFRDTPPAKRVSFMTPDGPILREDIWYWADGRPATGDYERPRPPLFMPRWASRITLDVTEVRVQRLQDISEADAIAEGIEDVTREVAPGDQSLRFWKRYRDGGWNRYVDNPIGSYASLWTEINGPGSWEANPWIAAYTFRPILGNVEEDDA